MGETVSLPFEEIANGRKRQGQKEAPSDWRREARGEKGEAFVYPEVSKAASRDVARCWGEGGSPRISSSSSSFERRRRKKKIVLVGELVGPSSSRPFPSSLRGLLFEDKTEVKKRFC